MYGRLAPAGGGPPLELYKQNLVVGRNANCDLVISSKTVSGKHCELELVDGYWWVCDLGSRHGTSINRVRCERMRAAPGDVLCLANQRFKILYAAPANSTANIDGFDEDQALSVLLEPEIEQAETPPDPASKIEQQSDRPPLDDRPAATPTSLGKLVPCGGGDPISLLRPKLLVGRSDRCNIQLKFPTVSGRHCVLTLENGYWFVQDLNSHNGVRVNGVRCQRKCLLPDYILGVAKQRYKLHYTPTGDEPQFEEDPFAQSLLEKAGLQNAFADSVRTERLGGYDDQEPEKRPRYTLEESDSESETR